MRNLSKSPELELIRQLLRISTIMENNNKKRVINEAFTKWIAETIGMVDNFLDNTIKAGKSLSDESTSLIRQLKNVASDSEAVDILAKLANSSKEFSDIITPRVMNTLSDAETAALSRAKNTARDWINNGESYEETAKVMDNFADEITQNIQFDGVRKIIKDDLLDYIATLKKSEKPIDDVVDDIVDDTEDIIDLSSVNLSNTPWNQVSPLSPESIRELEKIYRGRGIGGRFSAALRKFQKESLDKIKDVTSLHDEALMTVKSLSDAIAQGKAGDIVVLEKRLSSLLDTITKKDKVNFEEIDTWIDTNVLDYKLRDNIKKLPGYTKSLRLADGTTIEEFRKTYGALSERRTQLRKQLFDLIWPGRWAGKGLSKYGPESAGYWAKVGNKWVSIIKSPDFQVFRRWFLTGQTLPWSAVKKLFADLGVPRAVWILGKEQAYSYVMLAIGAGVINYITDFIGNQARNFEFVQNPTGRVGKYLHDQALSWDKHNKIFSSSSENEANATEEESSWRRGLLELPLDILGYVLEDLKNIETAIPGMVDNILAWYDKIRNNPLSTEEAKEMTEEGKNLEEQVVAQTDTLSKKAEEAVAEMNLTPEEFGTIIQNNPCLAGANIKKESSGENRYIITDKNNNSYSAILKDDKILYWIAGEDTTRKVCPDQENVTNTNPAPQEASTNNGSQTSGTLTPESVKAIAPCYWDNNKIDTSKGTNGIKIVSNYEFTLHGKKKDYKIIKSGDKWEFQEKTKDGKTIYFTCNK